MYLEINFAKEVDKQTENEKLTGIKLEWNISENYFAHGSADFEIVDFENLDLRAITTASLGPSLLRNRTQYLKVLSG